MVLEPCWIVELLAAVRAGEQVAQVNRCHVLEHVVGAPGVLGAPVAGEYGLLVLVQMALPDVSGQEPPVPGSHLAVRTLVGAILPGLMLNFMRDLVLLRGEELKAKGTLV